MIKRTTLAFLSQICLAVLFSIFLSDRLSAQDVPNTQLYLFDYAMTADDALTLSEPSWFSSFNPGGYNNQPYFSDGWWYCSVRMKDSVQNDIYIGHPERGILRQLTATANSEYSPTPIGRTTFSVVRVEDDGRQRLWAYHSGENWRREVLIPKQTNVGYHKWLSDTTVVMFLVSDPVSLQMANINGILPRFITSRIGRCLQLDSNGKVYFTQRMAETNPWYLKTWSPGGNRPATLIPCPPDALDFVILEDSYVLMSSGTKLYLLNLNNSEGVWKEVADFSKYNWPKITRLAISDAGQLMLVVNYSE